MLGILDPTTGIALIIGLEERIALLVAAAFPAGGSRRHTRRLRGQRAKSEAAAGGDRRGAR